MHSTFSQKSKNASNFFQNTYSTSGFCEHGNATRFGASPEVKIKNEENSGKDSSSETRGHTGRKMTFGQKLGKKEIWIEKVSK